MDSPFPLMRLSIKDFMRRKTSRETFIVFVGRNSLIIRSNAALPAKGRQPDYTIGYIR